MTPNQLEVLRLAHELGEIGRFKVSCKMGISTDYADYLSGGLAEKNIFHR